MAPSQTFGSRIQVMNGTALKTTGGLMKKDLKYNVAKDGSRSIVSVKASKAAKKRFTGELKKLFEANRATPFAKKGRK